MAVTSIWPVHGTLKAVVDYAENPEKTKSPDLTDERDQGFFDVLTYVANTEKTLNGSSFAASTVCRKRLRSRCR